MSFGFVFFLIGAIIFSIIMTWLATSARPPAPSGDGSPRKFEEGDLRYDHRGWCYIYRNGDWTHLVDKNTNKAINVHEYDSSHWTDVCPETGQPQAAIQVTGMDLDIETKDGWSVPIVQFTDVEEETIPYKRQIRRSREMLNNQT